MKAPYVCSAHLVSERVQIDISIGCGVGSSVRDMHEARLREIDAILSEREARDERQGRATGGVKLCSRSNAQLVQELLDCVVAMAREVGRTGARIASGEGAGSRAHVLRALRTEAKNAEASLERARQLLDNAMRGGAP